MTHYFEFRTENVINVNVSYTCTKIFLFEIESYSTSLRSFSFTRAHIGRSVQVRIGQFRVRGVSSRCAILCHDTFDAVLSEAAADCSIWNKRVIKKSRVNLACEILHFCVESVTNALDNTSRGFPNADFDQIAVIHFERVIDSCVACFRHVENTAGSSSARWMNCKPFLGMILIG